MCVMLSQLFFGQLISQVIIIILRDIIIIRGTLIPGFSSSCGLIKLDLSS